MAAAGQMDCWDLLPAMPGIFVVLQPDFKVVAVSDDFLHKFQLTNSQVVGNYIFDVYSELGDKFPPYRKANLFSSLSTVVKTKMPHSLSLLQPEVAASGPPDTVFWYATNRAVADRQGQVMYVIHKLYDFSDKVRVESELQKSIKETEDYKHALDESAIVAITNHYGIIQQVNDNFCKISKYTREELVGQDHRIINSAYHSKEFFADLWSSIKNGNVWRGEIRNQAKDGTHYWVDTIIVPFLNDEGVPFKYLAIRSDITKRKKAEAQLREVNSELEAFSYSVSHDLRSPLRIINGYAKILREDYGRELSGEANEVVDKIIIGATKMGRLIDDLLAFSRLGRMELYKRNVAIDIMVDAVRRELEPDCKDRNIEFRIGELLPARADSATLKQVWVNLLSNAVKYTRHKKYAIIEVGSKFVNGDIVYYVKDNGAGFDMEYSNKLFGVFQRLHSESQFEGTGVGLAIVQRIVIRHGGKVWGEGKVDGGAAFYFTLPVAQ